MVVIRKILYDHLTQGKKYFGNRVNAYLASMYLTDYYLCGILNVEHISSAI